MFAVSFFDMALIGAGIVFLGFILNSGAVKKIWESIRAQFGKGARSVWASDPVAVLQDRIDRSAEEIGESTRGLEDYRGMVESLRRQVTDGTKVCSTLDARIKLALQNKDEAKAGGLVIQLQREQEHLETNKTQLTNYEKGYENNLKKIKAARDRIAEAKDNARRLGAELKMSQAEREMATLANNFNVKAGSLDGLGEVTDAIQRKIDANRAVSIVSNDIGSDGVAEIEEREAVRQQEAKNLLEQYKAGMVKN